MNSLILCIIVLGITIKYRKTKKFKINANNH